VSPVQDPGRNLVAVRVLLDVSAVPDDPVGAGVYTMALASGLATRADVDLHLATRRADGRWAAVAPGATLHPRAPDGRPARLAWEQAGAPRLAARVAPDVWHGPHYTMPLRVPVAAVVTVHDTTFFDHPEWHERSKVAFFRRMARWSVARARAVVCVSEHTARRLRRVASPPGDVWVVHHGVDHQRFRPDADRAADLALLAAHGVTPPFVAFVGTLEPRKDVPTLVRAFAGVARSRPALRLVLAGGDGWGLDAARDAIADAGVATRVVRPGYVPHDVVPALYRRAEAVAYPSLEEGFGLPALEALACGAPLVTTRGSANEEVVGDAALLVPPGDVPALERALADLVSGGDVAARLRSAGPARAAAYRWDDAVARHVEVYRSAARRAA
jgi:glycosyltransferase involved in cell wall biosynthesis